jgi:hypothetical protein
MGKGALFEGSIPSAVQSFIQSTPIIYQKLPLAYLAEMSQYARGNARRI